MRELSLFTGAGGGVLGSYLLGWNTLGYVEINKFCQQLLRQRIDDGILNDAPIFGDIRAFLSQGYAESYQGMVDVISAGFPCQPFSVAGRMLEKNDKRNMWPETLSAICAIRPRYVFLENVPGLLAGNHGYFGHILGQLAESGYDARWCVLSAAEVGAPHLGKRLWIMATSFSKQYYTCRNVRRSIKEEVLRKKIWSVRRTRIGSRIWSENDADVFGVDYDVAYKLDRIKAIGNGQVPLLAATAWRLLTS